MRLLAAAVLAVPAVFLSAPAGAQDAAADRSAPVEPRAYSGLWYEIARTPTPFQRTCDGGVTASYTVEDDGTVGVLNRCDLPGGETSRIEGTAEVLGERFRQLQVDFPQSPDPQGMGANYVIAAVGPKAEDGRYAWAVVRSPDEGHGWILARDAELSDDARDAAVEAMRRSGIDTSRLDDTPQPPTTYDPADG